jgi:hypothetical protein
MNRIPRQASSAIASFCPSATGASTEKGVRLAQTMQIGAWIYVGIQL